jgi:hypothetical protein
MQKSRVIMDNRSALRGEWFGKVLQFGLEDASPAAPSLASPLREGDSAKNVAHPMPYLQLLATAAVLKCNCKLEESRRFREATHAEVPCDHGQSKCSSRGMIQPSCRSLEV